MCLNIFFTEFKYYCLLINICLFNIRSCLFACLMLYSFACLMLYSVRLGIICEQAHLTLISLFDYYPICLGIVRDQPHLKLTSLFTNNI